MDKFALALKRLCAAQGGHVKAASVIEANPVFQRMPTPEPVYTPPPRAINCTTTGDKYSLYTTCR